MEATGHAPGTVGNFGPGFDVMSLALAIRGDSVRLADAAEDRVTVSGVGADGIPTAWRRNCASVAVDHLRRRFDLERPLHVHVEKGVPPGSGLGSSASSSAAAAKAFLAAYGKRFPVTPADLLAAAAAGEAAVSGSHRDDVSAALFGGLVLVCPGRDDAVRVEPPPALELAVVRPHVKLETRRMRAVVPRTVPMEAVVANMARVARVVDACHRGDVAALGAAMDDALAAPHRAAFIPKYAEARAAALAAGAYGFAISGSGPSMFAVCDSKATADHVAKALADVYRSGSVSADAFTAAPAREVLPRAAP